MKLWSRIQELILHSYQLMASKFEKKKILGEKYIAFLPATLSGIYFREAQACKEPVEYPRTQNLPLTLTESAKCERSRADELRFLVGWGSLSPKPGRS